MLEINLVLASLLRYSSAIVLLLHIISFELWAKDYTVTVREITGARKSHIHDGFCEKN